MIDGVTILKQYHFVLSIGLVILISVLIGILAALMFEAMIPGLSSLSFDLMWVNNWFSSFCLYRI